MESYGERKDCQKWKVMEKEKIVKSGKECPQATDTVSVLTGSVVFSGEEKCPQLWSLCQC